MSIALRFTCKLLQRTIRNPISVTRDRAPTLAVPAPLAQTTVKRAKSGSSGDGAGKGGGAGGSIRDAGGKFGEMAAAREEEHFRKEQSRQILELKRIMKADYTAKIAYHENQKDRHYKGIKKHEKKIAEGRDKGIHDIHIEQHKHSIRSHDDIIENYRKIMRTLGIE